MVKNIKIWSRNSQIGERECCFSIKRTLFDMVLLQKVKSESYNFENFENFDEKESVEGVKIKKFSESKN